jgi:hypothetical protein
MAGIQWPTIAYIAGHVKPCKFHTNNITLLDYTTLITMYTGQRLCNFSFCNFMYQPLPLPYSKTLFSAILLLLTIHVHMALVLRLTCFNAILM